MKVCELDLFVLIRNNFQYIVSHENKGAEYCVIKMPPLVQIHPLTCFVWLVLAYLVF